MRKNTEGSIEWREKLVKRKCKGRSAYTTADAGWEKHNACGVSHKCL
jgi:hypothetical protein